MHTIRFAPTFLAALLGLSANAAPAVDESAIRTQIIQTIQGMIAAEERLDAAATWSVHADVPGYRWVDTDGTAYDFAGTKKAWTDYLANSAKLKYMTLHEEVLVLGPDLAFYTWTGSADVTPKEGPRTRNAQWTARYLCHRIDGAWKIIGGQESSAPGKPVETAAASPSSVEEQLRSADAAWLQAIQNRSLEAALDFYDPEAITVGSGTFPAKGLAAFRNAWAKIFANPAFNVDWSTDHIALLDPNFLACTSGTWHTPGADRGGPFLSLWRKQANGQWKVLVDAAWKHPSPGQSVGTTTAEQARAALEVYILEFWTKHDTSALARAFSPTMVYHYNGEVIGGTPQDHLGYLKEFGGAFPDLIGKIDHFAFADGIGAAATTWTGTHHGELTGIAVTGGKPIPPTGRKITIATNYIFRVKGGRIVGLWETWDEGGLYSRLMQPEPTPPAK